MIYLDNAATTKIDPLVLEEMMPYLTEEYGNAGTIYEFGQKARQAIKTARERVAEFIGAEYPEQIIFTSGGSESNNTVMLMSMCGDCLISNVEHDSIMNSSDDLVTGFLNVNNDGIISLDDLKDKIKEANSSIGLVCVMYVNNEIGSVNPVEAIGEICHENDILFMTDCVQAAGERPLNVQEFNCDFMSISSHKIHGPKGVGALYIRDRSNIEPLIHGGAEQEFGLRGGTENVAGIVGLGKACAIAGNDVLRNAAYVTNLKRKFWNELQYHAKKYGITDCLHDNINSSEKPGKILSMRFDGIDAETMILMLSTRGICVSAGSACKSHEQEPSRVLKAVGLTDDQARDTLRISFSRMNTENEVGEAAKIIAETAFRLREYTGNV